MSVLAVVPSLRRFVTAGISRFSAEATKRGVSYVTFEGIKGYALARNMIAAYFLRHPHFERLWMIDDDIDPTSPECFEMLDVDADIVAPRMPISQVVRNQNEGTLQWSFISAAYRLGDLDDLNTMALAELPDTGVAQVDAVGMGCTLIKRRVLEDPRMRDGTAFTRRDGSHHDTSEIDGPEIPSIFSYRTAPNGVCELGEDVDFCYRARKLGYTVAVYCDLVVGHLHQQDARDLYLIDRQMRGSLATVA